MSTRMCDPAKHASLGILDRNAMLIKQVVCVVPNEAKIEFLRAQRTWHPISYAQGFHAQIGGFHLSTARILSLWQDEGAYASFMGSLHDDIAGANQQRRFYESIRVDLFSEEFRMAGSHFESMTEALGHAAFLRIADCVVRDANREHFIGMQREVWHPGMVESGMLAGTFARHTADPNRFLVATLWGSEAAHTAYMQKAFPKLSAEACSQDDMETISGASFELEESWTLLAQ